jgi:hypothetical protein
MKIKGNQRAWFSRAAAAMGHLVGKEDTRILSQKNTLAAMPQANPELLDRLAALAYAGDLSTYNDFVFEQLQ